MPAELWALAIYVRTQPPLPSPLSREASMCGRHHGVQELQIHEQHTHRLLLSGTMPRYSKNHADEFLVDILQAASSESSRLRAGDWPGYNWLTA